MLLKVIKVNILCFINFLEGLSRFYGLRITILDPTYIVVIQYSGSLFLEGKLLIKLTLLPKMDELIQLIRTDIPEGRQNLRDSFTNLERVAEYCEDTYYR